MTASFMEMDLFHRATVGACCKEAKTPAEGTVRVFVHIGDKDHELRGMARFGCHQWDNSTLS